MCTYVCVRYEFMYAYSTDVCGFKWVVIMCLTNCVTVLLACMYVGYIKARNVC